MRLIPFLFLSVLVCGQATSPNNTPELRDWVCYETQQAELKQRGIPDTWINESSERVHWLYPEYILTFYIYRNAVGVQFCKTTIEDR